LVKGGEGLPRVKEKRKKKKGKQKLMIYSIPGTRGNGARL